MKWDRAIKWIMLVSGVLTLSMISFLFAPEAMQRKNFGAALDGPIADVVVRNWGALIALVGAMLVYGAFAPAVRSFVLTVTGISKIVFIGLLLTYGSTFLDGPLRVAVIVDSLEVLLFAAYLLARPRVVPEYS